MPDLCGAVEGRLLVPVRQVHVGDAGAGHQQDTDSLGEGGVNVVIGSNIANSAENCQ